MQDPTPQPQVKLSPAVEYDATTQTYAAWCDELAVATSAPTAPEAQDALLNAMRLAAEYVLGNTRSARSAFFAYVPWAEAVSSRSDDELKALMDVRS